MTSDGILSGLRGGTKVNLLGMDAPGMGPTLRMNVVKSAEGFTPRQCTAKLLYLFDMFSAYIRLKHKKHQYIKNST